MKRNNINIRMSAHTTTTYVINLSTPGIPLKLAPRFNNALKAISAMACQTRLTAINMLLSICTIIKANRFSMYNLNMFHLPVLTAFPAVLPFGQ